MSNEQDKFKHSKRLLKNENIIQQQLKIAKKSAHQRYIDEPHRLVKHNAMDCGRPKCGLCGNPRHIWKDEAHTPQEKKAMQDIENVKRTNGSVEE